MPSKNSKRDHKESIVCVFELFFKHFQKTSKLVQNMTHNMHFIKHSQASIKAIKYGIKHGQGLHKYAYSWNLKVKGRERTLTTHETAYMKNMVSAQT